jgi:hypothetical protein
MIKLPTELKTNWYNEYHNLDFFHELRALPLLSLHTLLDGLDQRIVRSLGRHFADEKTEEEIWREWEHGACWDKSNRVWMSKGGWLREHREWMANFDSLHEIVGRAEWCELIALRSQEEATA